MKKVYLLSLFIIFAFILKAQNYKMNEKNLHLKEMQKKEFLTKKEVYLTEIEKQKAILKSKVTKSGVSVSANEQDSLALVAFYNSTNGDYWTDNENWLTGNVETWKGITIDDNGKVIEIDLDSNNLTGTLPVEIEYLDALNYIWLYDNNISGEIPYEIGNLLNLRYLSLFSNELSGEIPRSIGNLNDLIGLSLSGNNLSGSVPSEINNLLNLYGLNLSGNQFTDLPDLSALSLSRLYIDVNNFDFGDFEATGLNFSDISDGLEYSPQANVNLIRTDNSGQITLSVAVDGTNNSYQWYKDDVAISGETSNTLTIADTDSGIFYCEITNTNYPDLVLKSNAEALNVAITHGITETEYDALVAFYNSTNGASWTDNTNWLSEEDVANWNGITVDNYHVTKISLSNNNLTGELPSEIGNLINLKSIWLGSNSIGGEIPTTIGNLTDLEYLSLYGNKLNGTIPIEIGNLINLRGLGLGRNNFSGLVPNEINNLVNLYGLYLSSNHFSNLPDLSALTSLGRFYIDNNNFDFGDFEATGLTFNDISYLNYSPQASIALTRTDDSGNVTFSFTIDGSNNTYQWYKDDVAILGETSNTLTVADTDDGIYYCTITDTNYPDLTLYTVAEGINANLTNGILTEEYDALVAMYNATEGDNWTDNTNWITEEPVANWTGITVEGTHVIRINIYNNNLIGYIPSDICNLTELTYIHFGRNQLIDLPDLSSLTKLEYIYAYSNKLTFEDIEPNIGVASDYFDYSPQANVGEVQEYTLTEGESKTISVTVEGDNNTYQWYKDDVKILDATSDTYEITDFTSADAGVYVCKVNNTVATDLELVSNNITLNEATVNIEDVSNNFVIYPNPTSNIFNIKFEDDNITSIEIVDLTGKILLNKVNINKIETFDISNLDNGIYFIIIKSDNNISTSKIVKN